MPYKWLLFEGPPLVPSPTKADINPAKASTNRYLYGSSPGQLGTYTAEGEQVLREKDCWGEK